MTSSNTSGASSFPVDDADTTLLSLPSSFDDSLCLDLYRSSAAVSTIRSSPDGERNESSEQGGADEANTKILQSQINGLNRQVFLLSSDLKSTQRESAIHQQRAERLETELRRVEASLESHEWEVAELRKTKHECQEAVAHAEERFDELCRQTDLRSDEQNSAIERLRLAQSEIDDLKSNISSLTELNTELESQLEDSRRKLKASICQRESLPEVCDSAPDRLAELQSAFTHGIGRLENIVTRQQEEILHQRSLLMEQAERTKPVMSVQTDAPRSEGNGLVEHCNIQHPLSVHLFHHKTQKMKSGSSSVKVSKQVIDRSE